MNTALERHYDFLPEYILTDTKSRECLTALASDIIRGQVFVPRLLSACRKYDPLADLSMYSNKAGLAKKIADSSLKSPELQRKLLHLWSRTAINVPFISKLPKDDMTWRQILLIYYQESKNKNDYPIESPILLSKILSKHNFPLSRDFKNLLDKYTSLLEIESLLYNLEPSTKLNINEKIDEFQKIAGVALSSEISPEALSRMADLFKNLENTIDQSFKKTHLALTYHQIILPELSFLQSLKSITPQQMAKGFLEEQQSFLSETQALFQSLFNRGGALAPFSALLLNLSKSELLNQRDHEEIDSYLKKISTLYTSMNLERTAPGAFVLAKLLCLPKPLKDEDLDCELPDLGYKFITSLKNGLLDPLAAPYLDNLALKELLFRPKVESPATPTHTLGEGDDEGQKLIRYPDRPKGSDSIAQISVVTPAPLGAGVSPPRESVEDTPKEAVFIEEPQGPPASIEELASLVRDEVTKTLEVSKGADHLDIMHFLPDEVSDTLKEIAMRLLEHRDTGSLLWLAVATQSEAFPERLARVLHLGLNFQLGYPQLKSSLSALLEEPDSLMAPGTLDANQARLLLATAMLRPLVLSPDSLAHEIVRRLASVLSDFPPLLELFELFQEKILSCDEDYHATIRQIFYKENLEHSGELLKKKTEFYLQSSPSRKLGYKKATDLWQDIILGRELYLRYILDQSVLGKENPELLLMIEEYRDDRNVKFELDQICNKLNNDHITGPVLQSLINRFQETLDLAEEWLDYHRNLKKSVIRRNAYWQNVLNDYSLKADRAIKNLESQKGPVATLLKESLMEIKSQSLTSVISDDPSEESFRRTGGPIYLENPEYDLRARLIAVDKVKYTVEGHLPRLREFLKFLESKDQDSLGGYLRHLNNTELLIPYAFLKTKPHYAKLTHPDSPLTLKALFEEALAIYPQRVEAFLNDALFSLRNLRLTGAITRTDEGRLIVRLMAQKAELGTIRDSMPEEDPEEASSGQARSEDLELSDMPGIEYLEPLAKIRAEVQDSLDFMERLGSENLNSLRTAWAQNRELCLFGRGAPADTYPALSGGKSSNTRNTEDSVRELYDGEVNSHLDDGELRATRSLIRRLRHLTLEGEDLPALPMPVDNTNYLADFARFLNLSHNHPSPFHYVLEKESPNDQNSLNQCLAHWSKLANLHDLDTRALEEELQAFMNTFGVALPRLRNSLIMDGAPHYLRLYHIETTMFSAAPILVPKECQEALLMLSWCENPSAQDFEDYIERLEDNSSPLIILSFSALTLGQRARVLHMARRRGLNFFLTDMFHYAFMATLNLTAAPERRRAFLASSVISGNLNPYLESVKGESRVFGGRSRLVKQLWDTAGPSMLYGGRHLGKSAILRHLASDPARHKPKDGQHIIYEDASKYLSLSDLIIEAFAPLGFKLSDTEELLPKIVKFLKLGSSAVKIKRVLLLIDNADTLLEEDIALGLPNLTLYSEISDLSQGSFRVVFCGGRVTRLLSLYVPNPISKGKAPLIMGPMDETDAREILVPPLSTLGYELPNKSFPGRMLSLAEGYPGVLSGFGRALIDHAQESLSPDTFPPFKAADKEIVLSMDNLDLKSSLVKIFEDSLGSHPLHKLIAYTIFFLTKDQERSLFLETVEPQKILSELSSNHRDFESLGLESLILTLDEMVDLSILAREGAGYRLRPERSSAMLPRDDDLILSVVMGLDSEQTKMSSLSLNSRQLSSSFQNPQSLKAKLKESLEFSDSKLKPTHIALEPDGLSFKDAFPSPLTFHQQHLILNASEDIVLIGTEAEGITRVKPQLMTLSLYNGHSVLDLTPNPIVEGPLDASNLNALLSPPNLKLLHPLEQNVLVIVDLNEGAPREIHLVKDFFLGIKELRRFTLVFLIHQEAEEKLPDLSSFSKSSIIKLQKWERGDLLRLMKDRLKEGDLEREVDELMELTQGCDQLICDMIKTNSPGKLDPKKLGTLNPTLEPFPKPPSTQKDLGDRGHFEDHDVPNP